MLQKNEQKSQSLFELAHHEVDIAQILSLDEEMKIFQVVEQFPPAWMIKPLKEIKKMHPLAKESNQLKLGIV